MASGSAVVCRRQRIGSQPPLCSRTEALSNHSIGNSASLSGPFGRTIEAMTTPSAKAPDRTQSETLTTEAPSALPDIPVIQTGPDFPLATLEAYPDRAHDLFDHATRHVPDIVLRQLDRPSRAWLSRHDNPHLDEVDVIASRLGRPGAYFLSTNYEWGCTCRLAASEDGASPRLIRVLDWRTPGLGRNLIAADVKGPVGRYLTLTWPGYSGVLSAMAQGRFVAALNQAPMRRPTGVLPIDWLRNRRRVWRMPYPAPAQLLRHVFNTASTFAEAQEMLTETRIASPAIFLLAGIKPEQRVIIERSERHARVHANAEVAANHWLTPDWTGQPRGLDSPGRAQQMQAVAPGLDPAFSWLQPPILNPRTRLVMIADAASGECVARGYEGERPATKPLRVSL
jgi:hypothetical protein